MEAALRQLDERCRVYQYLVKRTVDPFVAPLCAEPVAQEALTRRTADLNGRRPDCTSSSSTWCCYVKAPTARPGEHAAPAIWREPREALPRWLSTHQPLTLLEAELDAPSTGSAPRPRHSSPSSPTSGLARLARREAFRFFRQLVNYDPQSSSAATPTHAGDASRLLRRGLADRVPPRPPAGRPQQVKVLSMKEPPAQTFAHMLGDLLACPVSSSPAWNGSGPARTGCGETSSRAGGTSSTSASRWSTTCRPRHGRGDAGGRVGDGDGEAARRRADRDRGQRARLRACSLTLVLHSDDRGRSTSRPPRR